MEVNGFFHAVSCQLSVGPAIYVIINLDRTQSPKLHSHRTMTLFPQTPSSHPAGHGRRQVSPPAPKSSTHVPPSTLHTPPRSAQSQSSGQMLVHRHRCCRRGRRCCAMGSFTRPRATVARGLCAVSSSLPPQRGGPRPRSRGADAWDGFFRLFFVIAGRCGGVDVPHPRSGKRLGTNMSVMAQNRGSF